MASDPSLFDAPPTKPWREVPQALFLSWSPARQLAYMAARDEDSARRDPANAEFYSKRAAGYREDMRNV